MGLRKKRLNLQLAQFWTAFSRALSS